MKRMLLGILVGLGLATAAIGLAEQRADVSGRPIGPGVTGPAGGSELIVIPTALGEKGQTLTVVDPRQRVLSVYHIDLNTGKIALKSVRNIQWDLQMIYLNNEGPLPQEIRSLLEQR